MPPGFCPRQTKEPVPGMLGNRGRALARARQARAWTGRPSELLSLHYHAISRTGRIQCLVSGGRNDLSGRPGDGRRPRVARGRERRAPRWRVVPAAPVMGAAYYIGYGTGHTKRDASGPTRSPPRVRPPRPQHCPLRPAALAGVHACRPPPTIHRRKQSDLADRFENAWPGPIATRPADSGTNRALVHKRVPRAGASLRPTDGRPA